MRRMAMLLALIALAPLLMGGGPAPGTECTNCQSTGPAVSAVVVINTQNQAGVFVGDPPQLVPFIVPSAGKPGDTAIRLHKGTLDSGAIFNIYDVIDPTTALFTLGCDLTMTDTRFLNKKLSLWVPPAVLTNLFSQLGITVTSQYAPVITDIDNPVCTPDTTSGALSFQAVIQFEFVK